jgi:hypothetical protein
MVDARAPRAFETYGRHGGVARALREGRWPPGASSRLLASVPEWSIVVTAGLLALGLACYQLAQPHTLAGVLGPNEGYDDGVYAGAAIRFVHGVFPYRTFVFVAPPGILYLLSPAALIGSATSSESALVLMRCLTAFVTVANVVLVGLLMRRAGRAAAAAAAFILALWPLTVTVHAPIELEPYVVLFVLLGAIVLFGRGENPSRERLLVAGALLGFACAVKAFGILPAVAVILVWLPRWRRCWPWLLAGVLAGIVVPSLPFLIAAPHAFFHEVVVVQISRSYGGASVTLGQRLLAITGLAGLPSTSAGGLEALGNGFSSGLPPVEAVAIGAFVALALVIALMFGYGWKRRSRFEWWTLVCGLVTIGGMSAVPVAWDHYAYFEIAMLAPLTGVCASGVWRALKGPAHGEGRHARSPQRSDARWVRWPRRGSPGLVIGALVAVAAIVFVVQQDGSFSSSYLAEAADASALDSYTPPGSCVLSDYPSYLIAANRFTASGRCPPVVDPFGLYLVADHGLQPHLPGPYPVSFSSDWLGWLKQARYLVLSVPFSDYIPWNKALIGWFDQHYHLVGAIHHMYARPFVDAGTNLYVYFHSG